MYVFIIHLKRSQGAVIRSASKGKNSELESNLKVNTRFSKIRTILSYQISNKLTLLYKVIMTKIYTFTNSISISEKQSNLKIF